MRRALAVRKSKSLADENRREAILRQLLSFYCDHLDHRCDRDVGNALLTMGDAHQNGNGDPGDDFVVRVRDFVYSFRP
jgi:hypothetical protein